MFLIKLFVRVDSLFVYNDEPFLPPSKDLRFLEYFAVVITIFGEALRNSGQTGRQAFE